MVSAYTVFTKHPKPTLNYSGKSASMVWKGAMLNYKIRPKTRLSLLRPLSIKRGHVAEERRHTNRRGGMRLSINPFASFAIRFPGV
jgi:hypothetical protein